MVIDKISAGILFGVDQKTGIRNIVSDFSNPIFGPLGLDPIDLTINSRGEVLVIDPLSTFTFGGLLFSVDQDTGFRNVVSPDGGVVAAREVAAIGLVAQLGRHVLGFEQVLDPDR